MKRILAATGIGAPLLMKKKLAVAIGTAAIAATALAPTANAQLSWHTRTIIYWTGASCIQMNYPGGSGVGCGGAWEVPQQVYRGQNFGVDPVMGDASWISCEIWVEGELAYMDHAFAGDGHDVNCLRTKT